MNVQQRNRQLFTNWFPVFTSSATFQAGLQHFVSSKRNLSFQLADSSHRFECIEICSYAYSKYSGNYNGIISNLSPSDFAPLATAKIDSALSEHGMSFVILDEDRYDKVIGIGIEWDLADNDPSSHTSNHQKQDLSPHCMEYTKLDDVFYGNDTLYSALMEKKKQRSLPYGVYTEASSFVHWDYKHMGIGGVIGAIHTCFAFAITSYEYQFRVMAHPATVALANKVLPSILARIRGVEHYVSSTFNVYDYVYQNMKNENHSFFRDNLDWLQSLRLTKQDVMLIMVIKLKDARKYVNAEHVFDLFVQSKKARKKAKVRLRARL